MRSRKHALRLGFLFTAATVSALASSGTAFAQASAPGSSASSASYPSCVGRTVAQSESDAAHTIYLAGRVQYDDSNWDAAIAQFREAYRRDCTKHELLVIISRAYESKGDKQEALNALQTYLDRVPANSPDAPALRTRMDNIKRQLLEEQKKKDQLAPAPTAPPPSTAPPSTTPPPAEVREHTVYPWLVVGAGVVATAVGVVLIVTAPSLPTNCNATTGDCEQGGKSDADFADDKSRAGASQDQPKWGIVTAAGGGVLVVGGLLWHFLERTGPVESGASGTVGRAKLRETPKPSLTPQFGQGFAGLTFGGAF